MATKKDKLRNDLSTRIQSICDEDGLEVTFEQDIPAILQKLNENSPLIVSFDWFGNIEDHYQGSEEAVYYSKAIGKTIVLNYDGFCEFKSLDAMIDFLLSLEDQAQELEARLKKIPKK